jgi:hypothetical protein
MNSDAPTELTRIGRAVEAVFASLHAHLSDNLSQSWKNLLRMLQADRSLFICQTTDTKRGRLKYFAQED